MKIILKENIENLGKKGDIIDVAPGYGRNYLIPKKMAIEVTPTNLKMIEMQQQALRKGLEKEMKSYQALVEQLKGVTLTFVRKAGEKDAIFGSVSTADIKESLEKLDYEVEKKRILLEEPIKKLGNYTIPIKIFHDEKADIKIEVVKEGAEKIDEEIKTPLEEEKKEISPAVTEVAVPEEEKIEAPPAEKTEEDVKKVVTTKKEKAKMPKDEKKVKKKQPQQGSKLKEEGKKTSPKAKG